MVYRIEHFQDGVFVKRIELATSRPLAERIAVRWLRPGSANFARIIEVDRAGGEVWSASRSASRIVVTSAA